MAKIRAIVKRPDEQYGHMTNVSNTLKNLQKIVDGPIETVKISPHVVIICNEEGKLRGLEKNFWFGLLPWARDLIVGEVVVVGVDGEDFVDLPEWITIPVWKDLLKEWGNE